MKWLSKIKPEPVQAFTPRSDLVNFVLRGGQGLVAWGIDPMTVIRLALRGRWGVSSACQEGEGQCRSASLSVSMSIKRR
ncbi:hypothetical protein, partial [Sphingomonas sp. ABOLE]|uniref:hypothetical protein n=1 Tax=Sphingomonas sp. ABOLE TaxID=1985878 RepID=UPI0019D0B952